MILAPVFLGALKRRRTTTLLSLLSIAIGVALGIAVQVINQAALDEFGRGVRSLAGQADLQVVGPASGFSDGVYEALAKDPAIAGATPLIEVEVRLPGRKDRLRVYGVDVFTLAHPGRKSRPFERDSVDANMQQHFDSLGGGDGQRMVRAVELGHGSRDWRKQITRGRVKRNTITNHLLCKDRIWHRIKRHKSAAERRKNFESGRGPGRHQSTPTKRLNM